MLPYMRNIDPVSMFDFNGVQSFNLMSRYKAGNKSTLDLELNIHYCKEIRNSKLVESIFSEDVHRFQIRTIEINDCYRYL